VYTTIKTEALKTIIEKLTFFSSGLYPGEQRQDSHIPCGWIVLQNTKRRESLTMINMTKWQKQTKKYIYVLYTNI